MCSIGRSTQQLCHGGRLALSMRWHCNAGISQLHLGAFGAERSPGSAAKRGEIRQTRNTITAITQYTSRDISSNSNNGNASRNAASCQTRNAVTTTTTSAPQHGRRGDGDEPSGTATQTTRARALSADGAEVLRALQQPGMRVDEHMEFILWHGGLTEHDRTTLLNTVFASLARDFTLRSAGLVASQDQLLVYVARNAVPAYQLYVTRVLEFLGAQHPDDVRVTDVSYALKLLSFASDRNTAMSPLTSLALVSARHVLAAHLPACVSVSAALSLLHCVQLFPRSVPNAPLAKVVSAAARLVAAGMGERRAVPILQDILRLTSACQLLVTLRLHERDFMEQMCKYVALVTTTQQQQQTNRPAVFSLRSYQKILYMVSFMRHPAPQLFAAVRDHLDDPAAAHAHTMTAGKGTTGDVVTLVRLNWSFAAQGLAPPRRTMATMLRLMRTYSRQDEVPYPRLVDQLIPYVDDDAATEADAASAAAANPRHAHGPAALTSSELQRRARCHAAMQPPPLPDDLTLYVRTHYPGVVVNVNARHGPLAAVAILDPTTSRVFPWPATLDPGTLTADVALLLPGVPVACILVSHLQWIVSSSGGGGDGGDDVVEEHTWNGIVDRCRVSLLERGWGVAVCAGPWVMAQRRLTKMQYIDDCVDDMFRAAGATAISRTTHG